MKPTLRTRCRVWSHHGDGKNGRPRWLKEREAGRRGHPVERLAKKEVLALGNRRFGFYRFYPLDFRAEYREPSCQGAGK